MLSNQINSKTAIGINTIKPEKETSTKNTFYKVSFKANNNENDAKIAQAKAMLRELKREVDGLRVYKMSSLQQRRELEVLERICELFEVLIKK